MRTWKTAAYELYTNGLTYRQIANAVKFEFGFKDDMYDRVYSYLYRLLRKNKHTQKTEESYYGDQYAFGFGEYIDIHPETIPEKRVAIQNQEPECYDAKWDGVTTLKFAIIGDTQLGSKYTQLTHLHSFYDICEAEGIDTVYHTGDLTEGLKMRVGHEYELYTVSADEMRDDVINNYPRRNGITTYFITGNHDASIYKQVGYDIGQAIANARPDMKYLGRDCAVVNLTDNCTLELRHPWDGTAYALSYKIQKMIEAMESDSKPNILAVGHYHKAEYMFYRNVHALQTGCFQGQTPFTRGKGISVHMGGWIVSVVVDTDGSILRFQPEFIPYYASIKDDYKNFKR